MNVLRKSWFPLLALLMLLGAQLPALEAAPELQQNLIVNGGFETTGGSTGAANWLPWWGESAKPADGSFNYAFKPQWNVDSLNRGDAAENIYRGANVQRVINSWDPWVGGVKQVVTVAAGSRVRLTAYAKLWTSSNPWPAPSDTSVGASMRVGLDPEGSDNQFAGTVVWSGTAAPHGSWVPLTVEATVGAGGKVGVFLSADYRGFSRQFMASFWDEVSLTVVGAAGTSPTAAPGATSAPQPTAVPILLTPFTLPTAGADGNVIYVVQAGDTLWRIASIAGVGIDQLKAMNGLTSDILSVGQRLIVRQAAAAATPTSAPVLAPTTDAAASPTPAAAEATAAPGETQVAGAGAICAMMYEDVNGNGRRDAEENLVAGGQFTLVDTGTGAPVQAYTTDGINEPHCFEGLAPAAYTFSSAAPLGYNATMAASAQLQVEAGSLSNLEFGVQRSGAAGGEGSAAEGGSNVRLRTALFGAAGVMFLLLAAGVAGFLFLRRR